MFTGEDVQSKYDDWLERFEERASLASWSDEHKFSQFKLHLGGYTLRVFNILEPTARDTYAHADESMKVHSRSLDIPELLSALKDSLKWKKFQLLHIFKGL